MTNFSYVVGFKRKCNFGRNQLKYANLEDSQLAEDFGIIKCTNIDQCAKTGGVERGAERLLD